MPPVGTETAAAPASGTAAAVPARPARTRNDELVENFLWGTLLFVLVILVYLPAVKAGYIWDDDQLLTANPQVHSPNGWWTLFLKPGGADYFPLTSWTLWLEWHIWGMAGASMYHITNVLFHATVTVLTWQTLKRLRIPGAWLAAAVFGVHPVCVESVAWISERKNTISQIFFLLSIMQYVRYEEKGRLWRYVASVACFTLSLLAKTSVVMLPFVLMMLTWWRNPGMEKDWRQWKRLLLRMLPYFVVALVLGIVTIFFQYDVAIGGEEIPIGTLLQRSCSALFAIGFYLYSALWPFNLVEIYPQWHRAFREWVLLPSPHWQPPAPEALPYWLQAIPGLVILGFLGYCWAQRSKSWARAMLVALGCYIVAMAPALGLLKMSYMRLTLVADHFQYISIAAVIALVVAAGTEQRLKPAFLVMAAAFFAVVAKLNWGMLDKNPAPHATLFAEMLWIVGPLILAGAAMAPRYWKPCWHAFTGLMLASFCVLSYVQAGIYHSEGTLWKATLDKNPTSWQAHNHYGAFLYMQQDWKDAEPHFLAATQLKPENPESHNNLGLTYALEGRLADAIKEVETAVYIKDNDAMRVNLGNDYQSAKQFDKAVENYQRAITLNPDNPQAHCYLGITYLKMGKVDDAIPEFMDALKINPGMEEGAEGLIETLRSKGVNLVAPDYSKQYAFNLSEAMQLLHNSPVFQQYLRQIQQQQQQQQPK
ncbi:MAG TPA: tetratricopeptide repeat protein [Chthoniobacteraceae bacterium]|nr:tetratricopeptide repeat protein [Chthoniobacteraceae bacterium]